jgi:hypothetical protein
MPLDQQITESPKLEGRRSLEVVDDLLQMMLFRSLRMKRMKKSDLNMKRSQVKQEKIKKKIKRLEQTQIKKINKSRKRCHLYECKQTAKNKSEWIFCFECHTWCCYTCLPQQFKGACVKTI